MKKTYEKPVLTTEPFDVENVITASAPAVESNRKVNPVGEDWQVPGLILDWH